MLMPGRDYQAGDYRYGFNGKENDDEVKGVGNQQDYGMRIYDPRAGRFLSVDPLTAKFAYLTPYQFSSNTPIWATDLDGLEADFGERALYIEKPPTGHVHTGIIMAIFNASGGQKRFGTHSVIEDCNPRSIVPILDLRLSPSGRTFQEYTNLNSQFYVSVHSYGSQTAWINFMLGHFINGTGAENLVFPENGEVSSHLKGSSIVAKAYTNWILSNCPSSYDEKAEFDISDQAGCFWENLSFLSLENFVGSADINIERIDQDNVRVTIFNVTSITSGDYGKHVPGHGAWPQSIVRDPKNNQPQPFSNTSQTFQFTIELPKLLRENFKHYQYWDNLKLRPNSNNKEVKQLVTEDNIA
jgi:RHS repeat-associated protein